VAFGVVDENNAIVQWLELTGAPQAMRRAGLRSALSSGTAVGEVVRHGEAVVIPDATELGAQYPDVRRYVEVTGGRAYVGLPLRGRAHGDVIGVLAFHWARPRMPSADETVFFANVAQLAGQALLRARTYADEHAVATILQNAVLPALPARLDRFAVGACYRPATRLGGVGGDWYDALDLPGSRTFFTVGDVVGHGVPAAEDMAQLRNAARTLAFEGHDPAQVLTHASLLTERTTRGGFATIVVAIHDPATDAVLCATAGHPPMLVRDAHGNVTTIEAPTGPPLGAVSGETYGQVTVSFAPGDTAVLYSDGLVERAGVSIRDGLDRLRAAFRDWDGTSSLDELCRYLVASCAPEDDRRDDACVLAFARSC
jgi:stage II sporulation SpoE-like protein/GAF domain-containing protein